MRLLCSQDAQSGCGIRVLVLARVAAIVLVNVVDMSLVAALFLEKFSRVALTFSESDLLEFSEYARPAVQTVACAARFLAAGLGVCGMEIREKVFPR